MRCDDVTHAMTAVKKALHEDGFLIDQALTAYLERPGIPEGLKKSMAYSLFAGGKRLRPVMVLQAARMLGGRDEDALPMAAALEMIHTYSLIHDDLPAMDNDDFRRGKPTNHKVFGEGPAVLAGDGLLSLAMEILWEHALKEAALKPCLIRAAAAIARGAGVTGMVAGQSLDLKAEAEGAMDEYTLRSIHKGKTAALLTASVLAGAYAAGIEEAEAVAMREFGEQYGLLFQITDDILDVTGDAANMGKTLGKDAKAGKLTFVTHYGLEKAREKSEEAGTRAAAALTPFGERAEFFLGLIEYTLKRKT